LLTACGVAPTSASADEGHGPGAAGLPSGLRMTHQWRCGARTLQSATANATAVFRRIRPYHLLLRGLCWNASASPSRAVPLWPRCWLLGVPLHCKIRCRCTVGHVQTCLISPTVIHTLHGASNPTSQAGVPCHSAPVPRHLSPLCLRLLSRCRPPAGCSSCPSFVSWTQTSVRRPRSLAWTTAATVVLWSLSTLTMTTALRPLLLFLWARRQWANGESGRSCSSVNVFKNNNFGLKQLQTARVAVGGVVPN
jgi:hypothetical protein